jgi:hypothetical protein
MFLWCHLDIGVIEVSGSGKLSYFVNKVEKFGATCLFRRMGGPLYSLEFLAYEFVVVLEEYLRWHYKFSPLPT